MWDFMKHPAESYFFDVRFESFSGGHAAASQLG